MLEVKHDRNEPEVEMPVPMMEEQPKAAPAKQMKYFIIKILPTMAQTDQPYPPLNIANLGPMGRIVPKRNMFIPVSQAYVDLLDHTAYTEWIEVGEEGKKTKEPVAKMRVPYQTICEISQEGHDVLRQKMRTTEIKEKDFAAYRV